MICSPGDCFFPEISVSWRDTYQTQHHKQQNKKKEDIQAPGATTLPLPPPLRLLLLLLPPQCCASALLVLSLLLPPSSLCSTPELRQFSLSSGLFLLSSSIRSEDRFRLASNILVVRTYCFSVDLLNHNILNIIYTCDGCLSTFLGFCLNQTPRVLGEHWKSTTPIKTT